MIKEKYRKEVWSRNKLYMDNPCTLEPERYMSNFLVLVNDKRSIY